ncbi:hypothetical protein MASR1M90_09100 [Desulfovibrionales bacterium]
MINSCPDQPYLSTVVTARNDNHGGDMVSRIQAFVSSLSLQCRTFNLDAELIIVEWNPPKDKKRIYEEILWPHSLEPLSVRFIEVPSEIHHSLDNSDKFPLFQMIAKNVGIRRAKGKYILATNIDIIFSDELIYFLSQKLLNENSFYRLDRYDVTKKVFTESVQHDELHDYCKKNVFRIHLKDGTKHVGTPYVIKVDNSFMKFKRHEFEPYVTQDQTKLHTNACGDFTLMSAHNWHRLQAYPEIQKWSIYIDGLAVHMATAVGLKQVILQDPMRIYHIEHELGWAVIQNTIESRPSLDYEKEYLPWCKAMLEQGKPININNHNWGFADADFIETIINSKDNSGIYNSWINIIAGRDNRLYYRDQSPEALSYLDNLVKKYKPTRVIELGTLSGLSLRTWLAADPNLQVTAIDLSFEHLKKSAQLIPLDLSRVTMLEQDILTVNFPALWGDNDRIILFIDAHDLTNVPIMKHVLETAVPFLPAGSVVIVDDLWYSSEELNQANINNYFDNVILNEIDRLQCFEGYYAPYWEGGSFFGFMEVVPLMEWVNERKIKLNFTPGVKSASFVWGV